MINPQNKKAEIISIPNKEKGVSKTPYIPPTTKASFDHNFNVSTPFSFKINLK